MPTPPEWDEPDSFPTAEDQVFGTLRTRDTWASDWDRGHHWYHFITGYKYAADALMAHPETAPRLAYKLGPPIVFLYRHHLELALKGLARQCGRLLGRDVKPPVHHRLNDLWQLCLALLEEESPGSTETEDIHETTRLMEEFCAADLKSETFRYREDHDGKPWSCGLNELNVRRIQDVVGKISLLLDCISTALSTRE